MGAISGREARTAVGLREGKSMDEPRVTYTGTIQGVLRDLDNGEAIHAARVIESILERHPEYGSGVAREILATSWPDFSDEESKPAAQWMEQVRSMLDPLLVRHLHGRLAILGLCHLDKTLGLHLRSFARQLNKELLEDFESLLLPEFSGKQRYRRDFLKILQNRDKLRPDPDFPQRDGGFTILTNGGKRLDAMAGLCFQQNYNACLAARYRVSGEDGFAEFLRALVQDLDGLVRGSHATIGTFLPEPGGTHRPGSVKLNWTNKVRSLSIDPNVEELDPYAVLNSLTRWVVAPGSDGGFVTGERLVLFLEWHGFDEGAPPESLELPQGIADFFAHLPERMGFVISGLPASVRSKIEGSTIYHLELPEDARPQRGQRLDNDVPHGEDQLDILDEAWALADAIALKDMSPPLVVGVFGGWGAGKSFVMHLIEQRLQEIRCEEIGSGDKGLEDYPFVGHPYLVHFDAWTYAKGNLWASLMQTTLIELDRQLSLERALAKLPGAEARAASQIWKLLWELTDEQREILTRTPLGNKALERAKDFTRSGDSGHLWDTLIKLHEKEELKLKSKQKELQQLRQDHSAERQKLESEVDRELTLDSQRLAWLPVWEEVKAMVNTELNEAGAKSFDDMMRVVPVTKKLLLGLRNLPLPAIAFIALAAGGGFVLAEFDAAVEGYAQVTGVLAALATPVVRAWNWFEQRRGAYENRLAAILEDRMQQRQQRIDEAIDLKVEGSAGQKVADLAGQIRDSEATIEKIRSQIGITGRARSLNEFLQTRLEGGLYQKELGLLDQVQNDIQELSDSLLPDRALGMRDRDSTEQLFPRGDPRVVLFIDDLDRCPPDKVVEVLEAAQLLVKTQLFVVVIAIDVRYVTRALENEYKGVLIRSGEPSGLDYIEKIIQIPYRVRSVSEPGVRKFMRSQMEIFEPKPDEQDDQEEDQEEENILPEPTESAEKQVEKARLAASARAARTESVVVSPETIHFDAEEYAAITESCSALAVSPRTMKRLVNVFKLLKLIWYRQGLEGGPLIEIKKAMLAILALCARYPEVLRKLLAEMEAFYRDSSHEREDLKQGLVEFLVGICEEGAKVALYPPDWEGVADAIRNPKFFPKDIDFSRLGEANLHLLSSFSFVGETDSAREATLQRGFYQYAGNGPPPGNANQNGTAPGNAGGNAKGGYSGDARKAQDKVQKDQS
jgi:predicted KAP-like P-loop ATPase